MAYLSERIMHGAYIALDDPYQEERLPLSTSHYGQILFAHELVVSGDYAPVHVPAMPALRHVADAAFISTRGARVGVDGRGQGWGSKHGALGPDIVFGIARLVESAEFANITVQVGAGHQRKPFFGSAVNTILLRRVATRVTRVDQLHFTLEDGRGMSLATSVLPLR